jgi:hypothetical protein
MPQGRFLPHLHRDWAHHGHIRTRAGLTPAVGSPLLWAHPCRAGPARCIAAGLTIDPAVVERLKDQLSLPYEELLILAQVTRRSIPRSRARGALQRVAARGAMQRGVRGGCLVDGRRTLDASPRRRALLSARTGSTSCCVRASGSRTRSSASAGCPCSAHHTHCAAAPCDGTARDAMPRAPSPSPDALSRRPFCLFPPAMGSPLGRAA